MRIGIPKERKDTENRVSLTPAGVSTLLRAGHDVWVERGAGEGSGFGDDEYARAGAGLVAVASDVWSSADLIVKVKEPLPEEYPYFRKDLLLFTYLHLAAVPALAAQLASSGVTALGYETIFRPDGSLPLLVPMSEVAGRMATQVGAQFLERENGGRGVLLGGVPGVPPAHVTIVGGGIVGTNAAKIAIGMGATVTVLDKNHTRLQYLDDVFGNRLLTLASNPYAIAEAVVAADLVIGAVLVPGSRAPKLVTEDMVKGMRKGSVIVDVAVDQGGSVETITHPTTHSKPTYVIHDVVHYAVANMPGAVPRTSTLALTNATLPYIERLAAQPLREAARDPVLSGGFNVASGQIVHPAVANSLGLPYVPVEHVIP